MWCLEENSRLSVTLHYFGAFCLFVIGSISFVLNQNFSILSIILFSVQAISTIGWLVMMIKCPNEHSDRTMVHRISYWCILSEIVALIIGGINALCFLFCLDGDRIL